MSSPNRRGPKPLSDILGELFAARGFGRLRALKELEDAWNGAVGEPGCRQTKLGEVRRGVLNVTVAHPALLEELPPSGSPRCWPRSDRTPRARSSTTSASASARSSRARRPRPPPAHGRAGRPARAVDIGAAGVF